MNGNHLVISSTVLFKNVSIRTFALVDTGATGFPLVDKNLTRLYSLPLQTIKYPRTMELIDSHPIDSGAVTHVPRLGLNINAHKEEAILFVTGLGHDPLVLGIAWMQLHEVAIRFASNSLTFASKHCQSHAALHPATSLVGEGISIPLPQRPVGPKINIALINAVAMKLLSKTAKPLALTLYEINQGIKAEATTQIGKRQLQPHITTSSTYSMKN